MFFGVQGRCARFEGAALFDLQSNKEGSTSLSIDGLPSRALKTSGVPQPEVFSMGARAGARLAVAGDRHVERARAT